MKFEELKPEFNIGDVVFALHENCPYKTNILGIKINSIAINRKIHGIFQYMIDIEGKEIWKDAICLYKSIDDLIESVKHFNDYSGELDSYFVPTEILERTIRP